MSGHSRQDNHADQLNPNNDTYWQSRGFDERPAGWEESLQEQEQDKIRPPEHKPEKPHR